MPEDPGGATRAGGEGDGEGDGLDAARALLPGVELTAVATLGGSHRSVVRRVTAGSRSVIVKEFTEAGEGWVRESAALTVLPADAPVPRLVAAGDVPPVVVMSDVGTGPSVADALLGADPVDATAAVRSWAVALATLHGTSAGCRDRLRGAIAARAGAFPVTETALPDDLSTAAATVVRESAGLGVAVPAGAVEELTGLAVRLGPDGPAALTPADTCPDNNVRTADGLVLIDFEGAQWRHIAWDVAYLAVPWPSCWCAWRLPESVAATALAAYRATARSSYVDSYDLDRDIALAATGWAYITTGWFLHRALADDPPFTDASRPAPTRRALVLDRLARARDQEALPALASWAGRLRAVLADRWGEVALRVAAAYAR